MMKKTRSVQSGKETAPEVAILPVLPNENTRFPVVGIGASAGGLEALEQFLLQVPKNCGMAFVIIQHLDPTHTGMLPELLQRVTAMTVHQVTDRMQINPDCVYVIPPNKDMSILHGLLFLFEPTALRGMRLPIDFFFSSLAADRQEQSIGVILSGMGSDGTMGLRAIKEKGGVTLVQEPASAKFDSMPRSAIAAGVADIVALVEELPQKIIEYLHHARPFSKSMPTLDDTDQSALDKICILLRTKSGHDFSLYKKNTVYRRIERRMGIHQINKIELYVRYLQENPQEVDLLFRELLIGVTHFFRDPEVWEELRREAIPSLLARMPAGGMLRAWSAGCSTGEEAYSLAIAFRETVEQVKPAGNFTLQIFATDLDQDAIDRARRGVYPATIEAHVPPDCLQRFFIRENDGYRVGKEIREMVTFATQNIIMHPPFTKLDILVCRNLLIYLTTNVQKKLMPLFHYSLKPGGILLLGSSESINGFSDLFAPEHIKSRLFSCRETVVPSELLAFPASFVPALADPQKHKELAMLKPEINLQSLADKLLLQHFSPPAVLTNENGDILYISGRTGKYLEPAAGKANWNIFAMARDGIRFELGSAFQKVVRDKGMASVKGLKLAIGANVQNVDITLQLIDEPGALRGMVMIVFHNVAVTPAKKLRGRSGKASAGNAAVVEMEQELQRNREVLQIAREEMQTSQEELTSANEELQSTNEELQSTNEELTTSREEMQSLNEELQSVNAEQQAKMDELARVDNDMRNLLNSTEVITIFLNNDLHIRRFTPGADKLFKLLPGDVGRPLSDIANNLLYPEMTEEAWEVLRTLIFSEKQISTIDGKWFSVRIMPYRTMENVIAGVVLTFSNITQSKLLEAELRQENACLKALLAEHTSATQKDPL